MARNGSKIVTKAQFLPKYVFLKRGEWYVRRTYPTIERDEKGRIVYLQITKKCEPETAERAEEISRQIDAEVAAEKFASEAPMNVERLFTDFLDLKRSSVEPRTFEYYEYHYEHYIRRQPFNSLTVADVTVLDVQRLYTTLQAAGASSSAIRKVNTLLTAAFNLAVIWKQAAHSPTKGVTLPKENQDEITYFEQDEAKAFVAACRTEFRFAIFELALETGMRPQEYCALRWSDVNFDRGTVRVRQAVKWGLKGGGWHIGQLKTKASRRTVQISGELVGRLHAQRQFLDARKAQLEKVIAAPLILEHMKVKGVNYEKRARRRQNAREALRNIESLDLVFSSDAGTPLSRNNLNNRDLVDVLKLAGLGSDYSLYSLRHTSVTLLLEAGEDVGTIAERCGTSAEMIWRTYGHVLPSMRKRAVDSLSSVLY